MFKGNNIKEVEQIKLLNEINKKIAEIQNSVPQQIKSAIDELINGAPEAYDTLKEIADAFGEEGVVGSIISQIVQSDWNQTDTTKKDYIKNKPSILQGDWNQNDNTKSDYIKNRTHYGDMAVIYDEISFQRIDIEVDYTSWIKPKIKFYIDTVLLCEFVFKSHTPSARISKLDITDNDISQLNDKNVYIKYNNTNYNFGWHDDGMDFRWIDFNNFTTDTTMNTTSRQFVLTAHFENTVNNDYKLFVPKYALNGQKLDIKYIPDSLIERIERLENLHSND